MGDWWPEPIKRILIFATAGLLAVSAAAGSGQCATVSLGIDNVGQYAEIFSSKRVGLVTNATGYDSNLTSSVDVLRRYVDLRVLFAPEHGMNSEQAAGVRVDSYTDENSGLRVYSLYGQHRKPAPEMLAGIDVLAFDIQDIGVRYYTYISTLFLAMEAAGENGLEVVVFDRPNPLGGLVCEGIVQQTGYQSFVGIKPMPVRYGLTIGELAGYLNSKYHLNCRLTVVPMKNWRRSMLWDDTGLPWLPTSPNMPSWHTALIYAGTCLLEGTNVSEGRGTTSPFRFFGAPDLNNNMVVNKLNRLQLPGVKFRPVWFTPQTDKYAGQVCAGVDVVVTSESQFRSWLTGVAILQCLIESYPSFTIERKVDFSGAHSLFESQLGMRWESIYTTDWQDLAAISDEDCRKWADESKIYWIYREI